MPQRSPTGGDDHEAQDQEAAQVLTRIPNGLDEIQHTFGFIDDRDFETTNIVSFDLPYPLLYGEQAVHRSRCHRLVVDNFRQAFLEIAHAGLEDEARHYGGIYNQRAIRGASSHPSTHSWGIAIDLEPAKYPLRSDARFPVAIVDIFKRAGFFYGGDFRSRKDPMHFQICTGY